jgi:hypothetical protein
MYTGPKLTNDNLVFGYDTGYGVADIETSTRFYKGQPTTNVFTVLGSPSNTDQNVQFSVDGTGTFKRVAVGTQIGDYKVNSDDVVYSYALGDTGCHYHGNDYSSVSIGSKVSLNIEYFLSNDVGSFNVNHLGSFETLSGVSGGWGAVSSVKGQWHRVTLTRTATATNNLRMLMYPGGCSGSNLSNTGTIYYKNPTVTITDQPTPFVNGTRSSTDSLIDLKKTTDVDVSNVSFDSTGQPEFDGTNDVITTSFPATTIPTVTIEAVVYRNQATGRYEAIVQNNTASDDALYVNPSGYLMFWPCGSSSLTVPTGQWSHVAVSYNGTTLTYIVNGTTQVVTATCSHITDWDFLRIGGHGTTDGERWIGKVAVAKVYEKSLSAAELISNYNAYKNRFNI